MAALIIHLLHVTTVFILSFHFQDQNLEAYLFLPVPEFSDCYCQFTTVHALVITGPLLVSALTSIIITSHHITSSPGTML